MANTSAPIFNKRATEKLRSPDDLDKYVQVLNPSVWMVLASCLIFVLALLAWGLLGTVSTSLSVSGAIVNTGDGSGGMDELTCFISSKEIDSVHVGNEAMANKRRLEVTAIEKTPLSKAEAKNLVPSDYLASTLVNDEWVYRVTLKGDLSDISPEEAVPVKITVERVAPISLILRSRE